MCLYLARSCGDTCVGKAIKTLPLRKAELHFLSRSRETLIRATAVKIVQWYRKRRTDLVNKERRKKNTWSFPVIALTQHDKADVRSRLVWLKWRTGARFTVKSVLDTEQKNWKKTEKPSSRNRLAEGPLNNPQSNCYQLSASITSRWFPPLSGR